MRIQGVVVLVAGILLVLLLLLASTPVSPPVLPPSTSTPAPPTATPLPGISGTLLLTCGDALCLYDPETRTTQRIVPERGRLFAPRWSPQGDFFAVIWEPGLDEAYHLRLYNTDGTLVAERSFEVGQRILSHSVAWSHDSQMLALTLVDAESAWVELMYTHALVWEREPLESASRDGWLRWAPHNRILVYTARSPTSEVEVCRAARPYTQSTCLANRDQPTWYVDGTLTYLTPDHDAIKVNPSAGNDGTTLVSTLAVSRQLEAELGLSIGELDLAWPTWSPNGRWLAFRVWGVAADGTPLPGMLFTVRSDGTNLRRWPNTETPNTALQIWSPDSSALAYPYWRLGGGPYRQLPDATSNLPCASGVIIVRPEAETSWRGPCAPPATDLNGWASWSPDSAWLAMPGDDDSGVVLVSVNTPGVEQNLSPMFANEVHWRP